jgi:hypothetical protein
MQVTKPVKLGNGGVHQVIHTSNRHSGTGARPHFSRNRTAVELERKRHDGSLSRRERGFAALSHADNRKQQIYVNLPTVEPQDKTHYYINDQR